MSTVSNLLVLVSADCDVGGVGSVCGCICLVDSASGEVQQISCLQYAQHIATVSIHNTQLQSVSLGAEKLRGCI